MPVCGVQSSEREILWVMRGAILGVGGMALWMALRTRSIYGLWFLCSDLVYVILFPQLVSVIYLKGTNTYGSLAGYVLGILVRLSAGESLLGLPPLIHYPVRASAHENAPSTEPPLHFIALLILL